MLYSVLFNRNHEVLKFYEECRLKPSMIGTITGIREGTNKYGRKFYAMEFKGNYVRYILARLACRNKATVLPFHSVNWNYKDES